MRSEKTQGQDLMREVGMKFIGEDLGAIRDRSLVIADGVTGGKLWSGGPMFSGSEKTGL